MRQKVKICTMSLSIIKKFYKAKQMELPTDVLCHVAKFLHPLPYLFLFKRVSKAWKHELEQYVQRGDHSGHLHFGLSEMKLENMSLEDFGSIIKVCGKGVKKITLEAVTMSAAFIDTFVFALQDNNIELEELIMIYCRHPSRNRYNWNSEYRDIIQLLPSSLKRVLLIRNSNFNMVDGYYKPVNTRDDRVPASQRVIQSVLDLAEYNDDAYLLYLKKYQISCITQEEIVARFYNVDDDQDDEREDEAAEVTPFGVFERWSCIKKFMITRKLLPINAIVDAERGYNIAHAYLMSILHTFEKLPKFNTLEQVTEAFDTYRTSNWVKDFQEALPILINHGLNVNAKSKGKKGGTIVDLAERIDEKWLGWFKKQKKNKIPFSMEEFVRHETGIEKAAAKKKGKKRKRDDDSDDDEDFEENVSVSTLDRPKRDRKQRYIMKHYF